MEGRVASEPQKRVIVRRKERFLDVKLVYYTVLALSLCGLLYYRIPAGVGDGKALQKRPGSAAADKSRFRELGHELLSRGLYRQAVAAYERYLDEGDPPASEAAGLRFRIGDICKDKLGEYERAIAQYLQVRYHDPKSPVLEKVGLRVVACLDALGKRRQSQDELDRLTNVDRKDSKNRLSPIVASTGSRDFTLMDIEEGIEKLPESLKSAYSGRGGKLRFLREHLLAPYLFYEAGRRRGLDKDPGIRRELREIERNLVADRVIKQRLKALPPVTDDELELYYKAEKERFKTPDQRWATLWEFHSSDDAEKAMALLEKSGESAIETPGRVVGPVQRNGRVDGVEDSGQLADAVFSCELKRFRGPVRAGKSFWIVRPDREQPGIVPAFEKVRERVKFQYENYRRLREIDSFLKEQIEAQNVTIDDMAVPADQDGRP